MRAETGHPIASYAVSGRDERVTEDGEGARREGEEAVGGKVAGIKVDGKTRVRRKINHEEEPSPRYRDSFLFEILPFYT